MTAIGSIGPPFARFVLTSNSITGTDSSCAGRLLVAIYRARLRPHST